MITTDTLTLILGFDFDTLLTCTPATMAAMLFTWVTKIDFLFYRLLSDMVTYSTINTIACNRYSLVLFRTQLRERWAFGKL
jgi:hypothetical protein